MSFFIHTEADLDHAIARLVDADPRFGVVLSRAGRPPLRRRPDGFSGLASIVVSQQLSTASAKAIWTRLNQAFDPFDHAAVLRARSQRLARAGLSAPKIRTLKAIAKAIDRGELDLPALVEKPADEAHAALTVVHGIGPWTADIYLLFCLGHRFAGGDAPAARAQDAPDLQRDGAARRVMAAMARRGRLHALVLLSLGQAARRRADPSGGGQWLNSTVRGSSRARLRRASSSCSCTATAPTATT
jgi:DNA-3-methyladenine glycosylase II